MVDRKIDKWVYGLLEYEGTGKKDLNGDGGVNSYDAQMAGITNEIGIVFEAKAESIHEVLKSNPDGLGSGTARPDIFTEGNYSAFDILRFAVATREDLRFESIIKPEDSDYDTYEFVMSWDQNGDGIFDENDGENFNNSNWHFAFAQHSGDSRAMANNTGERSYARIDQFLAQPNQHLRFMPFSETMTKRRQQAWLKEQAYMEESDGKYIIPSLSVYAEYYDPDFGPREPDYYIENLEVRAHNLRSDIYQPGVITFADVFLSAAEQGHEFKLTWWPTLNDGTIVEHLTLQSTPVGKGGTYRGYEGRTGWPEFLPDIRWPNDGAQREPCGNFGLDGKTGSEGQLDFDTCFRDFFAWNQQGGYHGMLTASARIQRYSHGPVWVSFVPMDMMIPYILPEYSANETIEHNFGNDDTVILQTLDVPTTAEDGIAPILDDNHFGWQIADCNQCHNAEKDPKGHGGHSWPVNSADGFSVTQPYYCASCHGSNGAPERHNIDTSCFWCHSKDKQPKNHGTASTSRIQKSEDMFTNRLTQIERWAPLTNEPILQGDVVTGNNDAYKRDKAFPDPYSCGTCHTQKTQ